MLYKTCIGVSFFGLGTIVGYLINVSPNNDQYSVIQNKDNGNYYLQRNYKKIYKGGKFVQNLYEQELYEIKDKDEQEFIKKGNPYFFFKNFY